jgi:serine/threonine protein kinase
MLVIEYATDGNLRDYLHSNFDNTPWRYRLSILWTLAEGLRIIHNNNLVHRDFHAGNVLQQGLYSRIADVGLARLPNGASLPANAGPLGVMPYLAPEILRHGSYSKEGDIYAYGIIMWEISSGLQPFCDIAHDGELAIRICAGKRPPIIPGTPECYTELMEKCWDVDPRKRPTAEELLLIMGQWDINVIRAAEEFRRKTLLFQKEPAHLSVHIHPDATFVSRLLPNISNYTDKEIMALGAEHNEEEDT